MTSLDARIIALAEKYRPLAVQILREAIRIPADYVDKPAAEGGDPHCGLSNHEEPRLQYLRRMIISEHAVERPEDVSFDEYGSLVWVVQDHEDGIPPAQKKVVYFDGHTDTVNALRSAWRTKIGGVDCYDGMLDPKNVNTEFLKGQLGYLAPESEWQHLVWGRGSADQLAGVVGQIVASKIMLELKSEGALRGVIIRSYGTTAEEDNDGAAPKYIVKKVLPGAAPELIPDLVVITEGTGCSRQGALGIYRGQRGRMQIEVDIVGKSCHGSMPWMGVNPLEFGARIITEANDRFNQKLDIGTDAFLGDGTRVTSWAVLDTPSDCAVPERFRFRFDRRITAGEVPEQCVAAIERLKSVADARAAGCKVAISVPNYDDPTWRGYHPNNSQIYLPWVTPAEHPAIQAAVDAYRRVITHGLPAEFKETANSMHREPRVSRWIFSTDGVGYPVPVDDKSIPVTPAKRWIVSGAFKHPAILGLGAGYEQNTHKIGENVDSREVQMAIAFYARLPSLFREHCERTPLH